MELFGLPTDWCARLDALSARSPLPDSLARLIPILRCALRVSFGDGAGILAIEGRAASGKSTMAEQLGFILGGSVIHMDDFFLPSELRTAKRLNLPGGNVHYERFAAEVLPKLSHRSAFSYGVFSCAQGRITGSCRVEAGAWRIVEGAYSRHPALGGYPDLTVFSDVAPSEQHRRIILRDGAQKALEFAERWIPLEEAYFAATHIRENANLAV